MPTTLFDNTSAEAAEEAPGFKRQIRCIALLCALTMTPGLLAQQEAQTERPGTLVNLDLKELMDIEITSVSRRPERLSDAAASIFVITGDDIRRSGATNLPEALRLAPALQVVQVSASSYTVSARGFISSSSNKLLVLIDGRVVYTPFFAGVFWDVQDVLLEDVERIEVISGPGGTLWGVNAVNGIINIITRSAKQTQSELLTAGAGNRESIGAMRYGSGAGAYGGYRLYGKYVDRSRTETANGTVKDDAVHKGQVGFRTDWEHGANQFTLLGNAYKGSEGQPPPGTLATGAKFTLGTIQISGWNVTSHWQRSLGNGSTITVQGYFDRTERTVPPTFAETLNIGDLQFLHSLKLGGQHSIAWGGEYRYGLDSVRNSPYVAFLPAHLNQKWMALFAQDEITLRKDLRLTLGARSERNDYTGYEFLPNVRLAWNVAADHLLWTAASRTVRAPSRFDHDVFVPGNPPFLLTGGAGVISEVANVYELGYRGQPVSSITFSATAFHSLYDHLRTQEIAPSRTSFFFANGMKGTTSGLEIWGSYQASQRWRLSAGFDGLTEHLELRPGSNDTATLAAQQGRDAKQSWRLRSSLDLPYHCEFDVTARRVSALADPTVPAYSAVDLRFGWKPRRGTEVSVTGRNLFGKGHGEFTDISTRTEIGRSVFIAYINHFGGS
ncbi:MAG TPA: TonB-dependent receptor [Thermoanaerobaculia bacterium]|jgi:iron complex outermembrane receptor protein|nr:TonB-dependent receptor [Thermoanaerobaculia bacterium]